VNATVFAAPWFFFAFMVTQMFVLINMLVGIVVDYLSELRQDASKQPVGESELLGMLVKKVSSGCVDESQRSNMCRRNVPSACRRRSRM
jgi:hypothetical protein